MEGMLTAVGTLIVVVLILYLTFVVTKYVAGKGSLMKGVSSANMRVIDKVNVGRDRTIAIMTVGEKAYLVGITQSNINLLAELDDDLTVENLTAEPQDNVSAFQPVFKELFNKVKKKSN